MRTYKKQRYLFFWIALAVYFVPVVIAVACLLPFVRTGEGTKWGIGISVVALHCFGFLGGIFRGLKAHFPFLHASPLLFLLLAMFFTLDIFRNYVYTFMTIAAVSLASGVAASVLWALHGRYKRKAQTVSTVLKSGILDEIQKEKSK